MINCSDILEEYYEKAFALETAMWEASAHSDGQAFETLVSPDAVMICGGYRCTGKEYAGFMSKENIKKYDISRFEVIYASKELFQIHYVANVVADEKYEDMSGTFHVTSTWEKSNNEYLLIFNMDSRI